MSDDQHIRRNSSTESALSEYIGVIAHRLHTPVTAIRWQIEAMLDGAMGSLNEDQKVTLEEIKQSIENLNEFSRAMLYVYELEQDLPMLKIQEISVSDILKRVTKNLATLIVKKQGRITDESGNITITTDSDIAFTILRTLIENALRYSPDASEFAISAKDTEQDTVITVEDHGCGIPSQERVNIGKKFFRHHAAKSMWTDGVGLNLYIAMNLSERTGGAITFDSRENKGASFHWRIPKSKKSKRRQPWEGRG